MCGPEVDAKTILRNKVPAISAALGPSTMIALPMVGAILLKGIVSLPAALPKPSSLLLPCLRLLLRALRL